MARRTAALAMAACLLVSCSPEEAPDSQAEPDRTAAVSPTSSARIPAAPLSETPQPSPEQTLEPLPTTPATRTAETLAEQLDRATATLRAGDASASEARRAGEFQQLAVRTLASASAAFRRKVATRLDPDAARDIRGMVKASRSLGGLTEPQRQLPRWRIVAPLPPKELVGYYKAAQRRTGVPWHYLAAIHLVETRMGRIRGTSSAGAQGPMQFLPSTWDLYGAGGDINDPRDAILAAGRLLKHHGAPGDMANALWHYNPSDSYVRAVTEHARTMQQSRYAYRGYWHWRVLYRHVSGVHVLPVGYPKTPPVKLRGN